MAAVIAPDALALDDAPAPALTPAAPRGELPQRVTFAWDVVPPSLPKGATERLREVEREEPGKDGKPKKTTTRITHEPRLFDHGGKVYVVLDSSTDAERARQTAGTFGATVVVR